MSDYLEAQAEIRSETEQVLQPIASDKCSHTSEAVEINIYDLPRTYWLIWSLNSR
jgi:hypothetical protein